MADRKLSALVALTAPTVDDEICIIDSGVPKRVRMDALSVSDTWTPSFAGLTIAGAHTYSTRQGEYTRIGRMVHAHCYMVLTAEDTAATGDLIITGLPFVVGSLFSPAAISYDQNITMPAASILNGYAEPGTSYIYLNSKVTGGGARANIPVANLSNTSSIMLSVTYRAA
jgi:hypothetical protein